MTYGPMGPDDDFGASPYDEFLARFFGGGGGRPVRRVDIGQLMTEQTRELVRDAANQAAEWHDTDLDTDHLLWAATKQESTRRLLSAAGADPDAIANEIASRASRRPSRDGPPTLTPSAKRALLDAHQISRAVGSSYIGPEHLLFALAVNPDSPAGEILRNARVTPEALQQALAGGGSPGGQRGGGRPGGPLVGHADRRRIRPRPDRHGPRRPGGPGRRAGRGNRADDRGPLPADQEQPRAHRRSRCRQDRDRRGHRAAGRGRGRAGDPPRQARRAARPGRPGRRHPVPRRLRGTPEEGHRRGPHATATS